jgi:hypothetical protein
MAALQLAFTDKYGNSADYIKITNSNLDYDNSGGQLVVKCWKDDTAHDGSKAPVGEVSIPYAAETKYDADGCVKKIGYAQFKDKTETQQYTKLKLIKIKLQDGTILDCTGAIDYP